MMIQMRAAASILWLLFFATIAGAQDFQQWNEVDITAAVGKADFLVPWLARTDSRLPNPQLAATGLVADYALPRRLTLTGGYLFADLPQHSDHVHIPLAAVSESFRLGHFAVVDRNRFEKLVGYGTSPVRYRNRILADCPLGVHDRWHVFASDEIFFDLSAAAWSQNRFQSGGGARINRRLSLDVYYLQRNAAGAAPTTRVLGTTLTVKLARR
jgi:hypothetical protein